MKPRRTTRALLVAILLAWAGLALWRASGAAEMRMIERAYVEHYQAHSETGEPPAVRWDFERQELVEIPESEVRHYEGSGGVSVRAVPEQAERLPLESYGILLVRIPGAWFHGLFAAMSLILAALCLRR